MHMQILAQGNALWYQEHYLPGLSSSTMNLLVNDSITSQDLADMNNLLGEASKLVIPFAWKHPVVTSIKIQVKDQHLDKTSNPVGTRVNCSIFYAMIWTWWCCTQPVSFCSETSCYDLTFSISKLMQPRLLWKSMNTTKIVVLLNLLNPECLPVNRTTLQWIT